MGSGAPRPRPPLELVGEPAAAEPKESHLWRRAFLAAAVLLLLALGVLGLQARRVGELGARVETLTADLDAARAELAAREARLSQARDLADDLDGRLAELRALLAPEPAPEEAP